MWHLKMVWRHLCDGASWMVHSVKNVLHFSHTVEVFILFFLNGRLHVQVAYDAVHMASSHAIGYWFPLRCSGWRRQRTRAANIIQPCFSQDNTRIWIIKVQSRWENVDETKDKQAPAPIWWRRNEERAKLSQDHVCTDTWETDEVEATVLIWMQIEGQWEKAGKVTHLFKNSVCCHRDGRISGVHRLRYCMKILCHYRSGWLVCSFLILLTLWGCATVWLRVQQRSYDVIFSYEWRCRDRNAEYTHTRNQCEKDFSRKPPCATNERMLPHNHLIAIVFMPLIWKLYFILHLWLIFPAIIWTLEVEEWPALMLTHYMSINYLLNNIIFIIKFLLRPYSTIFAVNF